MKLTIFSDLHGNFENLEKLKSQQNLFFLGDLFTNKDFVEFIGLDLMRFYRREIGAEELYQRFSKVKEKLAKVKEELTSTPQFFKEKVVHILPGNHESKEDYENLKKLPNLHDFHLQKRKIDGQEFVGHGGMVSPYPEMSSSNFFVYTDEQIAQNLRSLNPSEGCIILMHEIPLNDYSSETRNVIEEIKPKLVIGGHNHQLSKREFEINGVKYLCAGMKGEFIEIDI